MGTRVRERRSRAEGGKESWRELWLLGEEAGRWLEHGWAGSGERLGRVGGRERPDGRRGETVTARVTRTRTSDSGRQRGVTGAVCRLHSATWAKAVQTGPMREERRRGLGLWPWALAVSCWSSLVPSPVALSVSLLGPSSSRAPFSSSSQFIFFIFPFSCGSPAKSCSSPALSTRRRVEPSQKHGCPNASPPAGPPSTPQGSPHPSSHRHARPQPWHSVVPKRQLRFRFNPLFHNFRCRFFYPSLPQQASIPPKPRRCAGC